jgi:hypothetical protein
MKKQLLTVATILFVGGTVLMTSCKKDDTSAPVITLKGNATTYSSLNAAYSDAGATATDDKDGDITSKITVTGVSDVNKNLEGTYTINYSVTDAAGNHSSKSRSVIVRNDAYTLAGKYDGSETDLNGPYTYSGNTIAANTVTVTTSTTVNNRVNMTRLGDFANNTVYMDIVGTSITLPSQTVTNVGTGTNTCDVHDRLSSGTGTVTSTGFTLNYNDSKVAPCTGSRTSVAATFVKK